MAGRRHTGAGRGPKGRGRHSYRSRSNNANSRAHPDRFTRMAKDAGYAARSVFKLEELDRQFSLLRPGMRVLDLGCHPGSWLKFVAQKVGPRGYVVGIDLTSTTLPDANVRTITGDVFETPVEILDPEGLGFDLVASDMAPSTTGMRSVDQARSIDLANRAQEVARSTLKSKGTFVCKVFQGPDVQEFVKELRNYFDDVKLSRPPAVRLESFEVYIVARGFRKICKG